jgi:hypothetical protein
MALDIDRLAQAMEDEAIVELQDEYGVSNIDETEARKGVGPIALGFARAIIEEFQNNAVATLTTVTTGTDTETGGIS